MEIFQDSFSSKYDCSLLVEDKLTIGFLFYKKATNIETIILFLIFSFFTVISLLIWYKFNFELFLIVVVFFFGSLFIYIKFDNKKNHKNGVKYLLNDISELKIIDNETIQRFSKSTTSSLTGAAVGGLLFGGAGAIVGSITSGNKNLKEQLVRVGVKFIDGNWVVLQLLINETMIGRINKKNLELMLEMTKSKQLVPF